MGFLDSVPGGIEKAGALAEAGLPEVEGVTEAPGAVALLSSLFTRTGTAFGRGGVVTRVSLGLRVDRMQGSGEEEREYAKRKDEREVHSRTCLGVGRRLNGLRQGEGAAGKSFSTSDFLMTVSNKKATI